MQHVVQLRRVEHVEERRAELLLPRHDVQRRAEHPRERAVGPQLLIALDHHRGRDGRAVCHRDGPGRFIHRKAELQRGARGPVAGGPGAAAAPAAGGVGGARDLWMGCIGRGGG